MRIDWKLGLEGFLQLDCEFHQVQAVQREVLRKILYAQRDLGVRQADCPANCAHDGSKDRLIEDLGHQIASLTHDGTACWRPACAASLGSISTAVTVPCGPASSARMAL